jgi:hypothetical protein
VVEFLVLEGHADGVFLATLLGLGLGDYHQRLLALGERGVDRFEELLYDRSFFHQVLDLIVKEQKTLLKPTLQRLHSFLHSQARTIYNEVSSAMSVDRLPLF